MFTLPESIAFGTMVIGGCGVAITALCKWRPCGTNGYVRKDIFTMAITNIKDDIKEIKETQNEIFNELKELRK